MNNVSRIISAKYQFLKAFNSVQINELGLI